jgi:hypothetical protein
MGEARALAVRRSLLRLADRRRGKHARAQRFGEAAAGQHGSR